MTDSARTTGEPGMGLVRTLVGLFIRGERYRSLAEGIITILRERGEDDTHTRSLARELGAPVASVADVLGTLKEAGFVRRAWAVGEDPRCAGEAAPWLLSGAILSRLGRLAHAWRAFSAGPALQDEVGSKVASTGNGVRAGSNTPGSGSEV